MDLPTKQHKVNFSNLVPLVLIGVGLIILGLVAAGVLSSNGMKTNYTVVPSEVNFPAPDLTLLDLSGNKVNLSDYRQNIVLINNWATWCPPCKAEMPALLKYFSAHADQGFMLIGIDAGDPLKDVVKFIAEYELTFPILMDPNTRALAAFQNDSLPSSYVIDRQGTVILAWTGPINREMLEKYITPLLEQ